MAINIFCEIERLLQYGLKKNLITKWDIPLVRNKLLEVLDLDDYEFSSPPDEDLSSPVPILEKMVDWAVDNGRLEAHTVTYRDLLDTKLMGCFLPSQTEIIRSFYEKLEKEGPEKATTAFYQLCQHSHYIRTDRIAKNESWLADTDYGKLVITINLSKPEKDPKAIAAAKNMKQTGYPKCLLCVENVGYRGRVNHPARQNHRIIPVTLVGEQWYFQFSPYVYYNEHCIVLKETHEPMKISKTTFDRLLEFVEQFPHYFIGSNADLPIVGGSILSHDHFQGGNYEFPMAKAEMEHFFRLEKFPDIKAGIVKWPLSVIRLQAGDRHHLSEAANHILTAWKKYSDETVGIYAFTANEPHNTITPIARKRGEWFEIDLVLRNNRTNDEHPLGIFHPHAEVHHIKKENIGLIEVMGLAVLPGRLKKEMRLLSGALTKDNWQQEIAQNDEIKKHLDWAKKIKSKHPKLSTENVDQILREEIGQVFAVILEHCGVFKRDKKGQEAFARFLRTL